MQDFLDNFPSFIDGSGMSNGPVLLFVCICLWVLSNMGELRRIWDLGMAVYYVREAPGIF